MKLRCSITVLAAVIQLASGQSPPESGSGSDSTTPPPTAAIGGNECTWTRDCSNLPKCRGIQDAACLCRLGSCVVYGNPFFRGTECTDLNDCNCRANPEKCYCKNGFCTEERWECHEAPDCKKLPKCKDKNCTCDSENLCEFHCSSNADCLAKDARGRFVYACNSITGYTCECQMSQCNLKKLPSQCEEILDCVNSGKCKKDQPCACIENQCVDPWYVQSPWRKDFPDKNCRTPDDCDASIQMCQVGLCQCVDKVKVNQYESWGVCRLRTEANDKDYAD